MSYRVLYQKGNEIHTWDYQDMRVAERDYERQVYFDKVMLLQIFTNNVKCIKQKPYVDSTVKKARSSKRNRYDHSKRTRGSSLTDY